MRNSGFLFCAAGLFAGSRPADIAFEKLTLDLGANETCAFADINGDRRLDIVSGENWYEAPKWTRRHFRDIAFTNNYIDTFSDLPLDVNGDGKIDIISVSWFSKKIVVVSESWSGRQALDRARHRRHIACRVRLSW